MVQFSLRRVFVSITLFAIGVALIAALLKGQLVSSCRPAAASLGLAFWMEGLCLPVAKKPLDFIIPAVIGAMLGLLMIPAT